MDFAQDVSSIDVPSSTVSTTNQAKTNQLSASVDMKLMEILMVFVIEFATGAGIAMASSWLLTMSEITAVLYWFYEYVLVSLALGFAIVWTVLLYKPSDVLIMLFSMQSVSVIGHTCILFSIILFFILFSALSYDNDKTKWIHASFLEPAFQYQTLELVQLLQLVTSFAFVVVMLVGFVFVRAQFVAALKSLCDEAQRSRNSSMKLIHELAFSLQNFSLAPYLRFACLFNVVLQEYLVNVLHRVCDELGECKFNVSVIPVPGNSDIMVLFVIYTLVFLVFECILVYQKINLRRAHTPHDTTPFVVGFIAFVHVFALGFLIFFYLPEYFSGTALFNTILWLASIVWYALEIIPLYAEQKCDATTDTTTKQKQKKNL